ncbi:hypothetical protein GCM10010121_089110 [Streptomyces brasiliensis]|uniref:Uncharacterized protein n=1 Tax=Streptomyces brasiliensis TaxID=1954 RepID=A0A917P773_9ACTN|nr:hypothetical protein GCM10010121_089110 [Streptomyces brasiliensis]
MAAQLLRQVPGEGGQQRPIRPLRLRRGDLSAEHRYLVPQDEISAFFAAVDRHNRASQAKIRVASR